MSGRRSRVVRLLTVVSGSTSADLVVAADAPLSALTPVLARLLGVGSDARPLLWTAAGQRLLWTDTLATAGVQDGETLWLAASRPALPEESS